VDIAFDHDQPIAKDESQDIANAFGLGKIVWVLHEHPLEDCRRRGNDGITAKGFPDSYHAIVRYRLDPPFERGIVR
jgi:hypothetical protein